VDILAFATLSFCLLFGLSIRELALSRFLGRPNLARYLVYAVLLSTLAWVFLDACVLMRRYNGTTLTGPVVQALFMHLAAAQPAGIRRYRCRAFAGALFPHRVAIRQLRDYRSYPPGSASRNSVSWQHPRQ
jgi:hypothetical protein